MSLIQQTFATEIIASIIATEGGYSNNPADRGGETMFGITVAVARRNGYHGPMRDMPREVAERIYRKRYIEEPGFDRIARLSELVAGEMADTGVNMGPTVPIVWLQRWLTALNRQGRDYPDLLADGVIGPVTLRALDCFLTQRGSEGEKVLVVALNCSQGARYLELAEARGENETFLYGWLRERVVEHVTPDRKAP